VPTDIVLTRGPGKALHSPGTRKENGNLTRNMVLENGDMQEGFFPLQTLTIPEDIGKPRERESGKWGKKRAHLKRKREVQQYL